MATTSVPVALTLADFQRLERIAQEFDISVQRAAQGLVCIRLNTELPDQEPVLLALPEDQAYTRLLAELCSRSVRWLYFNFKEPASVTFLKQTDIRLLKVAKLYQKWKSQGCPV
jgi:hypothetical protein